MSNSQTHGFSVEQILKEFDPRIKRLSQSMIGKSNLQQSDLEDLIQEFRQAVILALEKFSPEKGSVQALIGKTLENQRNCIYRYRMLHRLDRPYTPINTSDAYDDCDDDDRIYEYKEEGEPSGMDISILPLDVEEVLKTLPELEQRVCILLMNGYSCYRVAQVLKIPRYTFSNSILPALKKVFGEIF